MYIMKLYLYRMFDPEHDKLLRTGTIDYVDEMLDSDPDTGYAQDLEDFAISEMEIDKRDFTKDTDCLVVYAHYYDRKGIPVDSCHARIYQDDDGNPIGEFRYFDGIPTV